MGGTCCCHTNSVSATTAKHKYQSPEINNPLLTNAYHHDLQWASKRQTCTHGEFDNIVNQFRALLQQHQIRYQENPNIILSEQLLHCWKEHACSAIATSVKSGQSVLITNRRAVKHKIRITTNGWMDYLSFNADEKVWSNRTTTICLTTQLKQSPFGKAPTLHRHRVEVPVAKYALQIYGILIPRVVLCVIGTYVNDITAAAVYNDSGIFYSDLDNFAIYKYYTSNDSGNIGIDIALNVDVEKILFDKYYPKVIDEFNAKVSQFLEKNKFYRISATKAVELKVNDIDICYRLKYGYRHDPYSRGYQLIAYLKGFNNLNLKQVVNYSHKNNDQCCIQSDSFQMEWMYKRKYQNKYLRNWCKIENTRSSFENDCNFLASKKQLGDKNSTLGLIDAQKFFDFVNGESHFDTLCSEAQEIILNHSYNDSIRIHLISDRAKEITVKFHVCSTEETKQDEIILD